MLNIAHLGNDWFNHGIDEAVDELLIHEFGHHYCGNHLDAQYHEALCGLGARLKRLAMEEPEFFRQFETTDGDTDRHEFVSAEVVASQTAG